MTDLKIGAPIPLLKKGRKAIYDSKILVAVSTPGAYIYESDRGKRESIRRRARNLGFTVKTFADVSGGWNIKIS